VFPGYSRRSGQTNHRIAIVDGEAPVFVKAEETLFFGGPLWRIELVSSVWPDETKGKQTSRGAIAMAPSF
jgi:hypothetical protein